MMDKESLDIIWVLISAVFVVAMQGGFLCVESGVTRTKNSINVALKNSIDFAVCICFFWLFGFGLMFGYSDTGWIGMTHFAPSMTVDDAWLAAFFIFQAMFCATAATIVSGAISERVKFHAYVLITVIITVLIYPVFGHWAWGGLFTGEATFLEQQGFVDFAGSTVVHSSGGWIALAAILVIGPRIGRFSNGEVNKLTASNLPLAMLGLLLFVVGWVGFNGGSTLEINNTIPVIVANTILAAAIGMAVTFLLQDRFSQKAEKAILPINGSLAGMVAVTANCHAVDTISAAIIASVGAFLMLLSNSVLQKLKIDDAIGAIPVHLVAGIWGTLAVALFGDLSLLGTGLTRTEQLLVQFKGAVLCGLWSFGITYFLLKNIDRFYPLRVSEEDEFTGLNISEHGEGTPLYELTEVMHKQIQTKDLSMRAPVEPFTEVGQIAYSYNKVMEALEIMTRKTRQIVRDIREGIITFNDAGVITSFNPGAENLLQIESVRVLGKPVRSLFVESGFYPKIPANEHYKQDMSFSMQGRIEFHKQNEAGENTILEYRPYRGSDHHSESYTAVIRDVTSQRNAEEQLYMEKELALTTLASIGEGVITTDKENKIKYFNQIASDILCLSLEACMGKDINQCLELFEEDESPHKLDLLEYRDQQQQIKRDNQLTLLRPDGERLSVNITSSLIHNREKEVVGTILVIQDISKSRELERLLTHRATHDELTGLLNRREFENRLIEFNRRSKANDEQHVLCYLDLDQFKIVNDTCGHNAGDELLKQISSTFKDKLRAGDTLARLGGDEFGVLLNNCSADKGYVIANKLRESIEEFRFLWCERNFSVGVSIGLVEINGLFDNASEIMSMADAACYAAKDAGRNRVHVHKNDDDGLKNRWGQMEWATKIQAAIDEGRFCLARQAIVPVDPEADELSRYEMFVRMLDDEGGIIPPGAFIPAAERYSLITAIDEWVIANTLQWMTEVDEELGHVAINLSGVSINNNEFLNKLKHRLEQNIVAPEKLCFEITETAAIADIAQAKNFFNELKELGCKFSLDDFGSGLSSFGYLKTLPVDYLKIDGMFVRDILSDPIDHAMVESIHNVGKLMGLKTVAEFVEDEAILEKIRSIGIDYAQGYHFGKPEIIRTDAINLLKKAS